ncbi:MAG: zinc-ribbon domain-containing protein [Pseudomonadota bacterium]
MAENCRNCGAPLRPDDKFCSACGTEVDASLELTEGAQTVARQPSRARDLLVFLVLAAISTLLADFIEFQLAPKAAWDIQSPIALFFVYACLALGIFVILSVLYWRLLGDAASGYFRRDLAVRIACLLLGMSIMFYVPITRALYQWTDPQGPIWYQFDLLVALLSTVFFGLYLALARGNRD